MMNININININSDLNPMWVTGFSDGECSFSVSVSRSNRHKTGYAFGPIFAIELKDIDLDLLYKIQKFFKGAGKIHLIKDKGHAVYAVGSVSELENIIIPHFIKYPLLTIKRRSFLLFKEIVNKMYKKDHLNKEGVESIMSYRASMNKGLSAKFSENFPGIKPFVLPKENPLSVNDINVDWLVGFVDAEGCFFIHIRPNRNKTSYWVTPVFIIAQHSRDTTLFYLIKEFLGNGGYIIEEKTRDVVRYRAEKVAFIIEVIIPLFKNNSLQSKKLNNYLSFCSACDLIKDKAHLTEEGLKKIRDIKSNMNTQRKYL